MKIILEQAEIQQALEDFVSTNIPMVKGQNFTVDFSGTSKTGYEAALTIQAKADEDSAPVDAEETSSKATKTAKAIKPVVVVDPEPEANEDAIEETITPEVTTEEPEDVTEQADKTESADLPKRTAGPIFQFAKKG
jgi:hypothetical protein